MGQNNYASVSWELGDVITAAKKNGVTLDGRQAKDWWVRNENAFRSLMEDAGREMLAQMDFTSNGLIQMVKGTDTIDPLLITDGSFIRCTSLLSREYVATGQFPGLFADFYYSEKEGDFDTIFWIRFEKDMVPDEKTVDDAYRGMVSFANQAGKEFHVPVTADREGCKLYTPDEDTGKQ